MPLLPSLMQKEEVSCQPRVKNQKNLNVLIQNYWKIKADFSGVGRKRLQLIATCVFVNLEANDQITKS